MEKEQTISYPIVRGPCSACQAYHTDVVSTWRLKSLSMSPLELL